MKQYYWAKEFPCTRDDILDGRAFEYLESIRKLCFLWQNPKAGYYAEPIEFVLSGDTAIATIEDEDENGDPITYTQTWQEYIDLTFPSDSDSRCLHKPGDFIVKFDGDYWTLNFNYDPGYTYRLLNPMLKACMPPKGGTLADSHNAWWIRCPMPNNYYHWDKNSDRTKINVTDLTFGYFPFAQTEYYTSKLDSWKWLPKQFDPYEKLQPKALVTDAKFWEPSRSYTQNEKVIFDNRVYIQTAVDPTPPGYSPSGWRNQGWQEVCDYMTPQAWSKTTWAVGSIVTNHGMYYRATKENSYSAVPTEPSTINKWIKVGITDRNRYTWNPSSSYQKGDKVIHDGGYYEWCWDSSSKPATGPVPPTYGWEFQDGVTPSTEPVWSVSGDYNQNDTVQYMGAVYKWTWVESTLAGSEPMPPSDKWQATDDDPASFAAWNSATEYVLGDKVRFMNRVYKYVDSAPSTGSVPYIIQGWIYKDKVYGYYDIADYYDPDNTYSSGDLVKLKDYVQNTNEYYVYEYSESSCPANYPPSWITNSYYWQFLGSGWESNLSAWDSAVSYNKGERVIQNGKVYVWTLDEPSPVNIAPDAEPVENSWERTFDFNVSDYKFQVSEIEPRARHFTRPEYLGAQYDSYDVYSSSLPGSGAQTVSKNQYIITEGAEPPDSSWTYDDPIAGSGYSSQQWFADMKMAAAMQNYVEFVLSSNNFKIEKTGSWVSNYEYTGYAWNPSDPDNTQSRFASLNDYYWGNNGSGFEKCLELTGSFDWYFDASFPYIPRKVFDFLDSISKTPVQSEMNSEIINAIYDFLGNIKGTWRRTWKYSLGRPSTSFAVSGAIPSISDHYGIIPPNSGDTLSWINSWANNFSMNYPLVGYDTPDTESRHSPTQRIGGHAEYEIDRLVSCINEMWEVLCVNIGVTESVSVSFENATTGLFSTFLYSGPIATSISGAVKLINDMVDSEVCSLPYHDEYWSSDNPGWVFWGYGELNNGVSYNEFSSTYNEDIDEWVNWGKPRALFDSAAIATRMRIRTGAFAPQCLAPNSTAWIVIKAWSVKPSEMDIYVPCSFASFGPSDASIGGTVVPDEDPKVFILTFGYNQIKDDGAYLYIRCTTRVRTIGKIYPDEEPYWVYGGPSQVFDGAGDDTYYKSRAKGTSTSSAQAFFSTCGATELFATWDWNKVPDSIWKRDTTAPILVDTLDVVDTKAPLPNPPEFHIEPVVDKIKALADYQVYAMAKLVEDVPFAGGVEYLYVWDDYALGFIDIADIPDWQQSREYCWAVGNEIAVQDKIWNDNMATWKLKLKARDSSSNETLCTTVKELIFNEIFDLGLEINIRLCNPNAQPGDPDYGLKEIYFDAFWDGTPAGVDKTETLNWWTDFDWDYSFECTDASKNIPWLSETEGVHPDRSKVYVYQTGLSDQQIDDLKSDWAQNGIRWRVHVRYRPKTEPVLPWAFEFIGGWVELE